MRAFKARIFYNGYFDTYIDADTEDKARDIVKDYAMDYTDDVKLSYDFVEIEEVKAYA